MTNVLRFGLVVWKTFNRNSKKINNKHILLHLNKLELRTGNISVQSTECERKREIAPTVNNRYTAISSICVLNK